MNTKLSMSVLCVLSIVLFATGCPQEQPKYVLTVTTTGEGSVQTSPEMPEGGYAPGSVVTLTAVPANGWRLKKWDGDVLASGNRATVTMNDNVSVNAVFEEIPRPTRTLLVRCDPPEGGITIPAGQSEREQGQMVEIEAKENEGWRFIRWDGDIPGTINPFQLIITTATQVIAVFERIPPATYLLTINTVGNGSVNPTSGQHQAGSAVTLTATPDDGWEFAGWTGSLTNESPSVEVTMNSDITLTATFVELPPPEYTLTINTTGQGTVDRNPSTLSYQEGADVILTAIPAEGWQFNHWEGNGAAGTIATVTVRMNGDKAVTAVFEELPPQQVVLTILADGQGTTTPEVGQKIVDQGTVVNLTATANPGWEFNRWEGPVVNNAEPSTSITVAENTTVTAVFTQIPTRYYSLIVSVSPAGSGTVLVTPQMNAYLQGTHPQLIAQPNPGWRFNMWRGDVDETTNSQLILTMDSDKEVTAFFVQIPGEGEGEGEGENYYLTKVVQGQGSVQTNPSQPPNGYAANTDVTITATPANGWRLDRWEGAASGNVNPLVVTMNSNKTVTAVFTELPAVTYDLVVNVQGGGSTTPTAGAYQYAAGANITITATPNTGWHLVRWTGDGISGNVNPLSIVINSDISVTAVFEENLPTYALTITVQGQGRVDGVQNPYTSGGTATLTAVANSGWQFSCWNGDATGSANPLTVTMDSNKNVIAVFVQAPVVTGPTGRFSYPDNHGAMTCALTIPETGDPNHRWQNLLVNPMAISSDSGIASIGIAGPQGWPASGSSLGNIVTTPFTVGMTTVALATTMEAGGTHFRGVPFVVTQSGQVIYISLGPLSDPDWIFWFGTNSNGLIDDDGTGVPIIDFYRADWGGDTPTTYTLTIEVQGQGSTDPAPGTHEFSGGTVFITATPASGWQLNRWEGSGASGAAPTLSVAMDGNKTVVAVFEQIPATYTLTTSVQGNGTVSPASGTYSRGEHLTVTATPNSGWHFSYWIGCPNTDRSLFFIVDSDISLTAVFEEDLPTYTLTVNVQGQGTVYWVENPYQAGSAANILAVANSWWRFSGWSGDATGDRNPLTVTMDRNRTITATFVEIQPPPTTYTLTTAVTGEGTIVLEPVRPNNEYQAGDSVRVEIQPVGGWWLDHWEGSVSGSDNPIVIVMDGDKTVRAVLVESPRNFTLTVGVLSGNGTTSPLGDNIPYAAGSNVNITATPDTGWRFDHWVWTGGTNSNPLPVYMDRDWTVGAVFTQIPSEGEGEGEVEAPVGRFSYPVTDHDSGRGYMTCTLTIPSGGDPNHRWQNRLCDPSAIVSDADIAQIGMGGAGGEWPHYHDGGGLSLENLTMTPMQVGATELVIRTIGWDKWEYQDHGILRFRGLPFAVTTDNRVLWFNLGTMTAPTWTWWFGANDNLLADDGNGGLIIDFLAEDWVEP